MSTTTVHPAASAAGSARFVDLDTADADTLLRWVDFELECIEPIRGHDDRLAVRTLLDLRDAAEARRADGRCLERYIATLADRRAGYVREVQRDERDLAYLEETGDTSRHWPESSLKSNVRAQRENLECSRRYLAELDLLLAFDTGAVR